MCYDVICDEVVPVDYNVSDEDILNSHDVIGEISSYYPPNVVEIRGSEVWYYHGLEEGLMCWDHMDKDVLIQHIYDARNKGV
jgi:hypothetical protein